MTANVRLFAEMAIVIALALGSLVVVGTNPDLRARISSATEDFATRIEATFGLKGTIDQGERSPAEDESILDWQLRGYGETSAGGRAEGQAPGEMDFLAQLKAMLDTFWLQIRTMFGLHLGT